MTPTEQLYCLSESVQTELWTLVRAVAGLSQDERADVLAGFVGVAEAFLEHRPDAAPAVIPVFNAVGQVMAQIDRAAFPRSEEVA